MPELIKLIFLGLYVKKLGEFPFPGLDIWIL